MSGKTHYRQLNTTEMVSDDNLNRIARLIYKTDAYIYPCMFENIESAELILHDLLLSKNDSMFSLDNLYVAEIENGTIVGIILWKQGSLGWQRDAIYSVMRKHHIQEPTFFSKVCNEYFSGYQEVPDNTISVLNVCIDEEYRVSGLATAMLSNFLPLHPGVDLQLHVLAENEAAINVYKKVGFSQIDTINGFSRDDRALPCYLMRYGAKDGDTVSDGNNSCGLSGDKLKCLGARCPNHCCKEYSGFSDRLQAIDSTGFSEIILLPRDVDNLRKAGMDSLIVKSSEGHWTIATSKEGVCGALTDGKCSIYPFRPAICRCYPLYLDLFVGMCELTECPGVEFGKPKHYDRTCVEELLSIYEYWIQYYRGKSEKEC